MTEISKIEKKHVYYKQLADDSPTLSISIPACTIVCGICKRYIQEVLTPTKPHFAQLGLDSIIINDNYYYFIHPQCREIAETCPESLV